MYLQLLWHVAAQREIRRCRYCHRPIPNASASRLYCPKRDGVENKCRNSYTYHYGEGESNKEARKKRREASKKGAR